MMMILEELLLLKRNSQCRKLKNRFNNSSNNSSLRKQMQSNNSKINFNNSNSPRSSLSKIITILLGLFRFNSNKIITVTIFLSNLILQTKIIIKITIKIIIIIMIFLISLTSLDFLINRAMVILLIKDFKIRISVNNNRKEVNNSPLFRQICQSFINLITSLDRIIISLARKIRISSGLIIKISLIRIKLAQVVVKINKDLIII